MLKKLLKGLVSASMVLSMVTSVAASTTGVATGTQTPYVTGDDWGCPVSATVIKMDKVIDAGSVAKTDFVVTQTKQGYGEPVSTTERIVTDAYVSDARGNKVTTDSEYVTLQFYYDPSNTAFYYAGGMNNWADPYGLDVQLVEGQNITSKGETINTLDIQSEIKLSNDTIICPQLEKFDLKQYTTKDGTVLDYGIYTPKQDSHTNALVIWNHGAGERGANAAVPLLGNKATALASDEFQAKFGGAYVIAIQSGTGYSAAKALELIHATIDGNPDIDPNRIIVGGCSMGGGNTVSMLKLEPELFAAAYPICAAGSFNEEEAKLVANLPMWWTVAENDASLCAQTKQSVANIEAAGNKNIHTSIFPNVVDTTGRYTNEDGTPYEFAGHWSWTYVFNNACKDGDLTIWDWMAQQAKEPIVAANGTAQVVVTGDDWGCGISKVVMTLDATIDPASISAEDFTVVEQKPWYGTDCGTFTRKVIGAYACDEKGNAVEGASNKVAVELYISPDEGSPMMYSGRNNWISFYNVFVSLKNGATLVSGENTINTLNVKGEIKDIAKERICPQLDGYEFGTFTDDNGGVTSYALYKPAADNHTNALVMWNHGAGEYGTDVQIDLLCNEVTAYSGEEFQNIMSGAYVLVPQRRSGEGATTTKTVADLIAKVLAENPDIDPNRIIETGCSAGGAFTLNMEIDYPELFAAAAPICPAKTINEKEAEIIKGIPNWFIHAENDTTVKPVSSHTGIELLKAAGAEVHMSFFEDVHDTTGRFDVDGEPYQYAGHWSWIYADNNECNCDECKDLNCWEWMSKQFKATDVEYTPGYVVEENTNEEWNAPYAVTFTYVNDSGKQIAEIDVNGTLQWYKLDDPVAQNYFTTLQLAGAKVFSAYDWAEGMFNTGYGLNGDSQHYYMNEVQPNVYTVTIPVPGNIYAYDYTIKYADGTTVTIQDPVNPSPANPANGHDSGHSLAYVGNAENTTAGQEKVYARTDGKVGKTEFVPYTAVDGSTQYIEVYTPYGWDKTQSLPVVYVSHGGGGQEAEWMHLGAVANILDNLIAEGAVKPTIAVTMDNTYFKWNYDDIKANLMKHIVPLMEEQYNVSKEANDRAFCGLSMGGLTTTSVYQTLAGEFGYLGPWSATFSDFPIDEVENRDFPVLMLGAGCVDFGAGGFVTPEKGLKDVLTAAGVEYTWEVSNGAHDWGVWRDLFTRFASNYLWTKEAPETPDTPVTPENPGTEGGTTGGITTPETPVKPGTTPNVGIYNNAAYAAVATIALAGAAYVAFKKKED